jgi:hypothetical protein
VVATLEVLRWVAEGELASGRVEALRDEDLPQAWC